MARGAVLTHGNVLHNLVAARDTLPLQRGDVMLSMLPLSHMGILGAGLVLLIIVILIIARPLLVKLSGRLTVTYSPREYAPTTPATEPDLQDRLAPLQAAHDAGLITDEEYDARRKSLIEEF